MDKVIFRKAKAGGILFAVFPDQKGEAEGSVIVYDFKLAETEEDCKAFMAATWKVPEPEHRAFKKVLEIEGGFVLDVRKHAEGSTGRPKIDPDRKKKRCPVCKETKGREAFAKSSHGSDGLFSVCRDCSAVEMSARQLAKDSEEKLAEKTEHYKMLLKRIEGTRNGETPREIARKEAKARKRR